MRILFLINPTAGAGRAGRRWLTLEKRLRETGLQIESCVTAGPGEATLLARKAAGSYEVVAAVGGDGTASETADGLLSAGRHSSTLAIVPFGTGNDFAAALGIRTEADAVRSLVSGKTSLVDALVVHCWSHTKPLVRHVLLFAGVGIVSETLRCTNGFVKRLFGRKLSYPVGLAWALCGHSSPRMQIRCDGRNYDERFLFVGASNTEIAGGGMRIAPGARIDDGRLNVNLVQALGRWEGVRQLRRVCLGRHTTHPRVTYFAAPSLEIQSDVPLEVAADGELIGCTPARIEVRARALPVRVP